MRRVPSDDPNLVAFRAGGGAGVVPGIVIALMGIGALALFTRLLGERAHHAWVVALIGFFMLASGAVVVFGRRGFDLDLKARSYRRWWGLLCPWSKRQGSLEEFGQVLLTRELRRTKNGSYEVFPVRLQGLNTSIGFGAPRSLAQARQLAEDLSRATGLSLVDQSSGIGRVREAAHLDESLRERLQRQGGSHRRLPDPPAGMRSKYSTSERAIRFEIPPQGFKVSMLLTLVPLLILALAVAVGVILPLAAERNLAHRGAGVIIFSIVCMAVGVLGPVLLVGTRVLTAMRATWLVEATPEKLVVEERSPFRRRRHELASGAIEDIHVASPRVKALRGWPVSVPGGIVVVTDERILGFGEHLELAEKQWIRDVLEQTLSA